MKAQEDEIKTRLINIFTKIDMHIPINFDQILNFIIKDIQPKEKWTDKDIAHSLTRFIEK